MRAKRAKSALAGGGDPALNEKTKDVSSIQQSFLAKWKPTTLGYRHLRESTISPTNDYQVVGDWSPF